MLKTPSGFRWRGFRVRCRFDSVPSSAAKQQGQEQESGGGRHHQGDSVAGLLHPRQEAS